MASISKPPKQKNWVIQFYFEGKKYFKSLRVSNKRDALELKRLIERKLAEGTFDPVLMLKREESVKYLSDLSSKWINHLSRRKDITEGARYQYQVSANVLLKILGNVRLASFSPTLISDVLLMELDDRYAAATVKSKMAAFRAMFSYAQRNGWIKQNPFSGMVPQYRRKIPIFWRDEEIELYKTYWLDPDRPKWQQTYFITLLNTGNRKTEHFNLKWSKNVFLDEKMLKFPGKGNKERIVPLNDSALQAFRKADRKLGVDNVFWQVKNTYAVNSAWEFFQQRTKFPYNIHTTRSNFATWLVRNGKSIYDVMQILGWEDYNTAKIYLGFAPEFLEKDRNLVNF